MERSFNLGGIIIDYRLNKEKIFDGGDVKDMLR